jgi:hypothetical protein
MDKKFIGEILVGVIYIAILMSLVRPQSKGVALIQSIENLIIGLVGSVTGYNDFGGIQL